MNVNHHECECEPERARDCEYVRENMSMIWNVDPKTQMRTRLFKKIDSGELDNEWFLQNPRRVFNETAIRKDESRKYEKTSLFRLGVWSLSKAWIFECACSDKF